MRVIMMIMTAPSKVVIDYLLNKEETYDAGNDNSIDGHLCGVVGVATLLTAAVIVGVVVMGVCTAVGLSEMGECVEEDVS